MKHKNNSGQIYTPGLPMRLFIMAMALIIAGMHALMLREIRADGIDTLVVFMFMLILLFDAWFLWYGFIFTTQTRVIVNEDGIAFQQGGSRLFTSWDNISHFGIKGGGKHQQQGIYLYNSVEPDVTGLAERLFYGRKTNFIPLGQVINIPRHWGFLRQNINLEKLEATEFGHDVQLYAPHLLQEFGEKSKTSDYRLAERSSNATYVVGADSRRLRKRQ